MKREFNWLFELAVMLLVGMVLFLFIVASNVSFAPASILAVPVCLFLLITMVIKWTVLRTGGNPSKMETFFGGKKDVFPMILILLVAELFIVGLILLFYRTAAHSKGGVGIGCLYGTGVLLLLAGGLLILWRWKGGSRKAV